MLYLGKMHFFSSTCLNTKNNVIKSLTHHSSKRNEKNDVLCSHTCNRKTSIIITYQRYKICKKENFPYFILMLRFKCNRIDNIY